MSTQNGQKRSERALKWRADLWEIVNRLYDGGRTYAEIAEQLGITVSQVKSKIRGRQRAPVC